LSASSTDLEAVRIFAVFSEHVWEDSSAGVDEPIADLEVCEAGFAGENEFFVFAGICVESGRGEEWEGVVRASWKWLGVAGTSWKLARKPNQPVIVEPILEEVHALFRKIPAPLSEVTQVVVVAIVLRQSLHWHQLGQIIVTVTVIDAVDEAWKTHSL
jgi:hypothetical protein